MIVPPERRLYDALVAAAERGDPCPTNKALMQFIPDSPISVESVLRRLVKAGMIVIERPFAATNVRAIRITESAKVTALSRQPARGGYAAFSGTDLPPRCPDEWPADYSAHNLRMKT